MKSENRKNGGVIGKTKPTFKDRHMTIMECIFLN